MNVICLAIDRLRAAYLGAYGNTWISTPNFDRLAAESVLFDRMTIDTPCLEMAYRSLWQGVHAMCPASQLVDRQALPAILSEAGWKTALIASDDAVANHPLAEGFNERVGLTSSGKAKAGGHRTVSSLEETDAANFFAAAGEYINSAKSPFFLWLHTDTLGRIWDAPLEYRQQYTDEDDPTSGNWADVPNRMLPDAFDPDERVAIAHAYAGQVTAIDQLLGVLLDEIESAGMTESTLVALFSPRGFPLGEHKRIGPCDEALYVELTHVPCVLRLPGGEVAGQRYQELLQPGDLAGHDSRSVGCPSLARRDKLGRGPRPLGRSTDSWCRKKRDLIGHARSGRKTNAALSRLRGRCEYRNRRQTSPSRAKRNYLFSPTTGSRSMKSAIVALRLSTSCGEC